MDLKQVQEALARLERQAIDQQVVGLRWHQLKLTQCKRNAIHLNSPSKIKELFLKFLKLNYLLIKICSRYENHSPSTTQGNGTSSTSERDERNGTDKSAELNIKHEVKFQNRLKMCNTILKLDFPITDWCWRSTNEDGNETNAIAISIICSAHANHTNGAIC